MVFIMKYVLNHENFEIVKKSAEDGAMILSCFIAMGILAEKITIEDAETAEIFEL